MPEENFKAALLPKIKERGQRCFNKLAVTDTVADIVVVYDHNDIKADDYIDATVRSLFIDSEACCTCRMDMESLDNKLNEALRTRQATLGDIADSRPCKVLFLLRREDPDLNQSFRKLSGLIERAKRLNAESEICCLEERTGTGELPFSDFDLPEGASRCWITFADSTSISLVLLLMLSDAVEPSKKVVVADYCAMYNAAEFSAARHAKGFLNAMLNTEGKTFIPYDYWKKKIDEFRESFVKKYPAQVSFLPHYETRCVLPIRRGSIAEYYGIMDDGVCVSEHYFEWLLAECQCYAKAAFNQASGMGEIPIPFFTDNEKYAELRAALSRLKKEPSEGRRSLLEGKASKKRIANYNKKWHKEFVEACKNKLCEQLLASLPTAKDHAEAVCSTAQDLYTILNGNYMCDADSSVIIPAGKNWYNYELSDLLDAESTEAFTNQEHKKIIDAAFGIASDADSDCRNYAVMNNSMDMTVCYGHLVYVKSMPEGLIISGRVRCKRSDNPQVREVIQ